MFICSYVHVNNNVNSVANLFISFVAAFNQPVNIKETGLILIGYLSGKAAQLQGSYI